MVRVLKNWMEGADVAALLVRLRDLGYADWGPGASSFDISGERIVRAFQRDHGCGVDGIVGPQTRAALALAEYRALPVAPARPEPWVRRINELLALSGHCGYYSNDISGASVGKLPKDKRLVISRASAAQLATGHENGYLTQHGLTCGHFGTLVALTYLDDADADLAATGMNCSGGWVQRALRWAGLGRTSTCAVAIFDGRVAIPKSGWTWRPKGYASKFLECRTWDQAKVALAPVVILEYGSHIRTVLVCTGRQGLVDPVSGELLRTGYYHWAANGTKKSMGKPWTFRQLRPEDLDGVIHYWALVGSPMETGGGLPYLEV